MKNLKREIAKNRQALDALKEDFDGVSLKEAFTADEVRDYIPQIFADEIIMLGLREATARNLFPVVGQPTNDTFTQRYKFKNTRGAQIVRELNEIKTSQHGLKKKTFGFNKISSAALFSWERLMDSPLQDAMDEATFATSQVYQTENRLMWDNLTRFSQGSEEQEWSNWIDGPSACEDPYYAEAEATAIIAALENAYLSMTTPLTDRSEPASLRWLWSPQIETALWKYATYRRFDLKGSTPSQLTGTLENPFGIPRTVIEPGYYRANGALGSEWVPQPCDIYLVDTSQAAGIRERVSQRMDNFTRELVQGSGTIIWERLCMWTRHPMKYRRISLSQDYGDQIADSADIILKVADE